VLEWLVDNSFLLLCAELLLENWEEVTAVGVNTGERAPGESLDANFNFGTSGDFLLLFVP
jgi:hypothetical protein